MNFYHLYHGDCLNALPKIPDNSIDLVLTDPPYNIGKAEWDTIENYVEFMGKVFLEAQRVLKPTGSLYWFHNNIPIITELITWLKDNTSFSFKQFIVWNKKFKGASTEGFLQGFNAVGNLRNYQKFAEYCLFYTLGDDHYFNNQKTHHSVWDYEMAKRTKHITPKPIPLIENILKYSSKEGDVVLDMFLGSGSTLEACQRQRRSCIGIEIDADYIKLIQTRCYGRQFLDRQVKYEFYNNSCD